MKLHVQRMFQGTPRSVSTNLKRCLLKQNLRLHTALLAVDSRTGVLSGPRCGSRCGPLRTRIWDPDRYHPLRNAYKAMEMLNLKKRRLSKDIVETLQSNSVGLKI